MRAHHLRFRGVYNRPSGGYCLKISERIKGSKEERRFSYGFYRDGYAAWGGEEKNGPGLRAMMGVRVLCIEILEKFGLMLVKVRLRWGTSGVELIFERRTQSGMQRFLNGAVRCRERCISNTHSMKLHAFFYEVKPLSLAAPCFKRNNSA